MNWKLKSALGVSALVLATQAFAQVTFYENEGFRGRMFTTGKTVGDFARVGFNDRASSVVVDGGRWEACEDARFGGHCTVLKQGSYESLRGMGLDDRISSVRPVDARNHYGNEAPEPLAAPTYDYRRRPNEHMYEARVTSVREVRGPPEERCWTEHQPGNESHRGDPNVGGAVVGALIGGVLGHQVGSGRGNTAATVGGAALGAYAGNRVENNRHDNNTSQSDLDRSNCRTIGTSGNVQSYEVRYNWQGRDYITRMDHDPGRFVELGRDVNADGTPYSSLAQGDWR
jgi:uncharacterized protein YcfJ